MRLAELKDRESIERWLNKQSTTSSAALAHRAAMRVLPICGSSLNERWAIANALTALPLLRCGLVSAVASMHSELNTDHAKHASAALVLARAAPYVPALAANSSARAANAAYGKNRRAPAAAVFSAARTIEALGYDPDDLWTEVLRDVEGLENGDNILFAPLWRGKPPNWFRIGDLEMLSIWDGEPVSRWSFWRRWWEGAKTGSPLDWELLRSLVDDLKDPEDWVDPDRLANSIAVIETRLEAVDQTGVISEAASNSDATLVSIEKQLKRLEMELELNSRRLEQGAEKSIGILARFEELDERFSNESRKFSSKFEELERKYRSDFDGALAAFVEQQSIKAPVELWKTKEGEHNDRMQYAFVRFMRGLLGVAGLICAVVFALLFGGDSVGSLLSPVGCDPQSNPEACKGFSFRGMVVAGSVLSLLTLALWYTRLQMKEYLSERHLALDARERQAFVQGYIGLLAEGDSSEEAKEQRALVYAALFRPSSDGIIKEDGGFDPSLSAVLSKLLAGK